MDDCCNFKVLPFEEIPLDKFLPPGPTSELSQNYKTLNFGYDK